MPKANTKQRILDVSLDLFSVSGYEGVTIKQIADQTGIKDSSLYKHFKSKQDIFDTLFTEMTARFEDTVSFYRLPQGEIQKIAGEYGRQDLAWLKKACETIFLFMLQDPKASKFRKMLMIEQYKNQKAAHTFRSWFTDDAIRFQTELFTEMIAQGYFREGNPRSIAMQFYAPFYLLLCQYDTIPDKEEEALALLMEHIEQFATVYQIQK